MKGCLIKWILLFPMSTSTNRLHSGNSKGCTSFKPHVMPQNLLMLFNYIILYYPYYGFGEVSSDHKHWNRAVSSQFAYFANKTFGENTNNPFGIAIHCYDLFTNQKFHLKMNASVRNLFHQHLIHLKHSLKSFFLSQRLTVEVISFSTLTSSVSE